MTLNSHYIQWVSRVGGSVIGADKFRNEDPSPPLDELLSLLPDTKKKTQIIVMAFAQADRP